MVTTKQVFEFATGFGTMGLIAVFILFLTYILSGMDALYKNRMFQQSGSMIIS